jgi:hypothetical protein
MITLARTKERAPGAARTKERAAEPAPRVSDRIVDAA